MCVCGGGGPWDSEVSLIPHLCAKVLLVLADACLPYLRVLWHVCQWVGPDDVAIKTEKSNLITSICSDICSETMDSQVLHDVVELQHGVRRRVDEDVGQRVLMVVHFI